MTPRILFFFFLFSALAQAEETSADADPPVPEEKTSTSTSREEPLDPRAEYHKGNAAFREGRLTAARFHYRRSVQGELAFDAMCNLGRTEASLHDDVAAYEHLTQCLDLHPSDAELIDSKNRFADLRREVYDRMSQDQRGLAERRLELSPLEEQPAAPSTVPYEGPEEKQLVTRTVVTVTAGAISLLGVGVGTGLFIHSEERGRAADGLRDEILDAGGSCSPAAPDPRCAELQSLLSEADDFHNASIATLAASGGLLVGAFVTALIWPQGNASSSSVEERDVSSAEVLPASTTGEVTWTPVFHPAVVGGGAWLGIQGRF